MDFPNGYGNQLVSIDDLRSIHSPRMHPEYARRLFACIEDACGLVGIGNGWRSTEQQAASYQRSPRTFAPPGLSFHETHQFASGIVGYQAVDTVGRDGRHDEAWDWMRDNAGRFGLRTFWNVNGEPWHTQCNDLANGVSTWKSNGCPDPGGFGMIAATAFATSSITGSTATGSTATGSTTTGSAVGYGLYPLNPDKPTVQLGWHGDLVEYLQRVILDKAGGNITVDGDFGPKTDGRVRDLQSFVKLSVTGAVDWGGTWQIIDHLAGNTGAGASGEPSDRTAVDHGLYWIQRGDSPWLVAKRVYGAGNRSPMVDPCDPVRPGFGAPDHQIRLPEISGFTTTVRQGDRAWSIIGRLYPEANPADLLDRFHVLNGGPHRILHPGDVVFLDRPL